ncbi:MAG: 50S ribosomal protein L11 methyltransferase [Acidobacteria bacterium]|nr:50S ribosomal protein L11 methyltransferase [Acidobacteriota bacterium]
MRTWPALELASVKRPELVQAALVDYPITAVDETSQPDAWRVVFRSAADRDAAAEALARQFPDEVIRSVDVPDEDWVARSQATLRAVQVGGIIVAPPWDVPHTGRLRPLSPAEAGATGLRRPLVIVIRPSMGFGTGHHATTRLCLTALQQVPVQGRSVVDVGTGSGLLAIAASRLGASRVLAIDDNPNAVRAAEENLGLNRGADVTLRAADVRGDASGAFDIVLANLTGALLRGIAARLRDLAAPGGHLILSGFMRNEEAGVLAPYGGLPVKNRTEEEEWLCVTLQRP